MREENKMKMIIIGAGIAGTMAYNFFREYSPTVFEKEQNRSVFEDHKAIMRIENEAIGYLTGMRLSEFEVENWIWHNGNFYDKCTPLFGCLYSKKVSGEITSRSIENTGLHKRFKVSSDFRISEEHLFSGITINSISEWKQIGFLGSSVYHDYDVCISTMPMPKLLDATNTEYDPSLFSYKPIYVMRFKTKIKSDKNYTVYIPEKDYPIYRISLQEDLIIIESTGEISNGYVSFFCKMLFGIGSEDIELISSTAIPFGKMASSNRDMIKGLLLQLTEKYNIYSLGRYAIWKSIKTDHLLADLKKIRDMINCSVSVAKYNTRKEL
jgi:hypothetical protein